MNRRFSALILALVTVVGLSSVFASPTDLDTCRSVVYSIGSLTTTTLDSALCDTLRIGGPCPIEYDSLELDSLQSRQDSIAIPVYAWFDEPVGGFSFGFAYNSDMVEITSINTSRIPGGWTRAHQFLPDQNRVLAGALDLFGLTPLPPTPGDTAELFFTLYLKVKSGATKHYVNLDTAFIAPAGTFTLAVTGVSFTSEVSPILIQCDSTFVPGEPSDINLPVTEVETASIPESYSLSQNVPNPFNPTTYIDFSLPRSGDVKVEVFNVMGQKVKTLVNEYLKAGFKRVSWDGSDERGHQVSSGVYFYRMSAGDFTETKKMLMLK